MGAGKTTKDDDDRNRLLKLVTDAERAGVCKFYPGYVEELSETPFDETADATDSNSINSASPLNF